MLAKYVRGWMIITSCYFLTLLTFSMLYPTIFQQPIDHNWYKSGIFVGIPLIIVPYLTAGFYVKRFFVNKRSGAVVISLIPVISERLLIFFIGYLLVLGGGDGSMNGISTMMFIRGEAASYYTPSYILCGVLSVLICFVTATYKQNVDQLS
ncbi:hypothetical protein SAMN05428962_2544 [Paenibacillus sp. BC26]|nr:hypothetical protein SAMN05428962_2544 [Paenibacillus sp. BC26]